ncbi:MAG: DUF1156 domain-containing protein, partial [Thermogutta sp.]|nr:DUF1156 domain-containing protein [Thermogutta sp.]
PYYPADSQGNIPLAYIWARTITCEGPGCGAEVPLLGMLWLSKKSKNLVALRYRGVKAEGTGYNAEGTRQKAEGTGYNAEGTGRKAEVIVELFSPRSPAEVQPPIVKRFAATCPCCGYTTPYKSTREQLRRKRGGTRDARLVAVITLDEHGGRHFRLPNEADLEAARQAERALDRIAREHTGPWPFVPDEPTPPDGTLGYRINKYGMEQWSDVYLPRQALALGTFCELVGEARGHAMKATNHPAFADALGTCLGIALGRTVPYNAATSFNHPAFGIKEVFLGSGFPMKPDFAECNPLIPKYVGGFEYSVNELVPIVERESSWAQQVGNVQQASATAIPLPDDSVGYVVTDPPYYDAVPYAALSDFCYVWLKRALGGIHRDLFASELTPKGEECILDPGPPAEGGVSKDREYFERTMEAALADARRTLKPDGVGVVIFAHKGTAGWEALLNALVNAGWAVTGSWPIDTERESRWRAVKSATLSSSVHLVCRPRENPDGSLRTAEVGDWREVLAELPRRVHEWMPRLAQEGIVGADAIFACLGPALEIFSRYARVEKASGEQVSLREY